MRMQRTTCFCLTAAFIFSLTAQTTYAATAVTITDSAIQPSELTVKVNVKVDLDITNRGNKPHNFVLKKFFVFTQNLNPGQSTHVSFTPSSEGSFPYYSDTGGKPEPGIHGTMNVKP